MNHRSPSAHTHTRTDRQTDSRWEGPISELGAAELARDTPSERSGECKRRKTSQPRWKGQARGGKTVLRPSCCLSRDKCRPGAGEGRHGRLGKGHQGKAQHKMPAFSFAPGQVFGTQVAGVTCCGEGGGLQLRAGQKPL